MDSGEMAFEGSRPDPMTARASEFDSADPDQTLILKRVPLGGDEWTADEALDPEFTRARASGEYRIRAEIARGGMGTIYAGEDQQLARQVAVKVGRLRSSDADLRFEQEAKVLAQLDHPNIVPVYALGVDAQGRPFYSMKLVKGRTLQAILDALKNGDKEVVREFPVSVRLSIFRKACDAVAYAHSKRILHRDLKPENIMVGQYGEVLVMDWGLAKVQDGASEAVGAELGAASVPEADSSPDLTVEGQVMGTPQYMSPEQARGAVNGLDERTDIYALGGILYALLALRPPVEGVSLDEVLTRVKSGRIRPMTTELEGRKVVPRPLSMDGLVPRPLQAVTRKAMALERERRYRTVRELEAEVDAYQSGFATIAEEAGAWREFVLFVRRHRALASMIGLFLVASGFFTVRFRIEQQHALRKEREAMGLFEKSEAAMQNTRLKAAKAQIALAEFAEESLDAEQMHAALSGVPEDLRDPVWEYLDARTQSVDLKIQAPTREPWLEVESLPKVPETVLGIQTDGQLSTIHVVTGKVTPLWKAEKKGAHLKSMTLSFEGDRLALIWINGGFLEAEIRNLETGKIEGSPVCARMDVRNDKGLHSRNRVLCQLSRDTFLLWTNSQIRVCHLEAWDIATGKPLWNLQDVRAFQMGTGGSAVWVLNTAGDLEQISVREGVVRAKKTGGPSYTDYTVPGGTLIAPDASWVTAARQFTYHRSLDFFDLKKSALQWSAHQEAGHSEFVQYDANSRVFAVARKRSILGRILEIRDAATGGLIRSHPYLVSSKQDNPFRRIAVTSGAFATALQNHVLVWNTESQCRPVAQLPPSGRCVDGGQSVVYAESSGADQSLVLRDMQGALRGKLAVEQIGGSLSGVFSVNRAGTQFVMGNYGGFSAFALEQGSLRPLWTLKSGNPNQKYLGPEHPFAIHPEADRLWVEDKILEFSSGRELVTLETGSETFLGLRPARHRCGDWVGSRHLVVSLLMRPEAEGAEERCLALWNTETGVMETKTDAPSVNTLGVSPDRRWIAEGGIDKRIRIRSGTDLKVRQEFRAHDTGVTCVVWHPHRPLLVSYAKGSLRIWNSDTWKMVEEIRMGGAEAVLEIPEDGRRLCVTTKSRLFVYEPAAFRD